MNSPNKLDRAADAISTVAGIILGITFILVFLFGMEFFESFISVTAFGIVIALFSIGGGSKK